MSRRPGVIERQPCRGRSECTGSGWTGFGRITYCQWGCKFIHSPLLELEAAVFVVLPTHIATKVAEAVDGGSDEDKCRFQTTLQDKLDIILTLYEVVYSVFPGRFFSLSSRVYR